MDTQDKISNLRQYVNDMIAVERDVLNAISGQLKDDRIKSHSSVHELLTAIAAESDTRLKNNEKLSEHLDGKWGAVVKEAVAATTGVLAGIYGMVRKHPMSRMLRDDHVALNLSATAYGMLYTTAVTYGDDEVAALSLENLRSIPPRIMQLTQLLPSIVIEEVSAGEKTDSDIEEIALLAIESAWSDAEKSIPTA